MGGRGTELSGVVSRERPASLPVVVHVDGVDAVAPVGQVVLVEVDADGLVGGELPVVVVSLVVGGPVVQVEVDRVVGRRYVRVGARVGVRDPTTGEEIYSVTVDLANGTVVRITDRDAVGEGS
jgi:hypothetical protein